MHLDLNQTTTGTRSSGWLVALLSRPLIVDPVVAGQSDYAIDPVLVGAGPRGGSFVTVSLIASSAANGQGVAGQLINFLRRKCDQPGCSDIRFWTIEPVNLKFALAEAPAHILIF